MQQGKVSSSKQLSLCWWHLFSVSKCEDDGMVSPNVSLLRGGWKNSEMLGKLDSLFQHLPKERHAELSAQTITCVPTCTHLIRTSHWMWVRHSQSSSIVIECLRKNGRCFTITLLNFPFPTGPPDVIWWIRQTKVKDSSMIIVRWMGLLKQMHIHCHALMIW